MRKKFLLPAAVMTIILAVVVCIAYISFSQEQASKPEREAQLLGSAASTSEANGARQSYGDELIMRGIPEAGYSISKSDVSQGINEAHDIDSVNGDTDFGAGAGARLTKLNTSFDEKIIKTAGLDIQVKKGKFDASSERAIEIAQGVGGYISQSRSQATGDKLASGEIIMRVPARAFENVLLDLKRLGKVKSLDISSEEVSEEYVDLQSRLRNWRAQEAVLLNLMRKANTISDSIAIQNNLSQVQMEIEKISGRLKFLDDRTSYATIRMFIAEPQVIVRPDRLGLVAAIKNAVRAGASVLGSVIILIGYIIPLAVLGGAGYLIYRAISSARRRMPEAG